jgi:hypothetical protein
MRLLAISSAASMPVPAKSTRFESPKREGRSLFWLDEKSAIAEGV